MDEFGGVFGQGGRECRVAIYARVSTHEQQTLPLQLAAMREYARRRGWLIVLGAEEVASGASKRVERQRVLDAARRREIDAILVWRLDRWGRSLADLVSTLDELRSLEVGFVSITEALDLTTPAGRAMAAMLSVFAEFEREVLRDRVRAGLASARTRGSRLGRPPKAGAPPDDLAVRLAAGESVSSIARSLALPRSRVRRWANRQLGPSTELVPPQPSEINTPLRRSESADVDRSSPTDSSWDSSTAAATLADCRSAQQARENPVASSR